MATLRPSAIALALGLYLLACAVLFAGLRGDWSPPRFGFANTLTLSRLVITCILAAFVAEAGISPLGSAILWLLFALTTGALIIDGIDGFAARRLGLDSAFGARFDMEVDALLILVLSIAAMLLGKAGVWVIASGLLRYVYVLAARVFPALNRPLPPAWRRKTIAVVQGATLAALLTPIVQPPVSTIAAALALVLLVYSFGADIVAQVRRS